MSTDRICTGAVYTSIDNVPPPPTLHLCDAARSKHRNIHIRPEVVGWAPLGDLAPQSTSFGTVALRERRHLAMTATCPEGEAWAASRNWNHGTHFLWDPRAAPTFHPLSTLRHRAQCRTFHFQLSTIVQIAARGSPARCDRVEARGGRSGIRLDGYAIFPGTSTQTGGTVAFLIVFSSRVFWSSSQM